MYDIKDVFHRLLWRLRPRKAADAAGERQVLVAREASVMELFAVDLERLAGGRRGARRAAEPRRHPGPQPRRADGRPGRRLRPAAAPRPAAAGGRHEGRGRPRPADGRRRARRRGAETPPPVAGRRRRPACRASRSTSTCCARRRRPWLGAGGVGLYRSEFLFLARRTLPTEEEQVGIYRKLLQRLAGRPATHPHLRPAARQAGGLRPHHRVGGARPYDWRLVLESLPLRQLFHEQVRAILRAAT